MIIDTIMFVPFKVLTGESMYRFYINKDSVVNDNVTITGSDVNHIKNVLRMKTGERIVVNDGMGNDYYCVIESISSELIELIIESSRRCEAELKSKLYLFQALPKLDKMELIIQKAVELGAFEVIPVITERCVVKLDGGLRQERKLARWQSIAEAAAKQSARGIIPIVHEPVRFKEALNMSKKLKYNLIPFEHAEGMAAARQCIEEAAGSESVGIFIGPEGGFEDKEIDMAIEAGAHAISLGNRILRTETAGMAVLSILMIMISQ